MKFFAKKYFLTFTFTAIILLSTTLYININAPRTENNEKIYVYKILDEWCRSNSYWFNGTIKITLKIEERKVHYYVKWTHLKWKNYEYEANNMPKEFQPFNGTIELGYKWYWFTIPIYHSYPFYCYPHGIVTLIFFNPENLSKSIENFIAKFGLSNSNVTVFENYIEITGYYTSIDSVTTHVIIRINHDGIPLAIISENIRTITLQQ